MGLFLQSLPVSQINSELTQETSNTIEPNIAGLNQNLQGFDPKMISQNFGPQDYLMVTLIVLIIIGVYIFLSLAYQRIGKKAGLKDSSLSWIFFGIVTIYQAAKMHFWPWPFLIVGTLLGYLLSSYGAMGYKIPLLIAGGLVLMLTFLVFIVMIIIWHWKTFEKINKPGWWALIAPIVGTLGYATLNLSSSLKLSILGILAVLLILGSGIIYLVILGIAAWSKE